jgi:hypothetical protein
MFRHARLVLALVSVLALAACSEPEPPITVAEGAVTVVNSTDADWNEVLITVNDHFRGFVPTLKAEGRANAPLSQFTTGHGQRWNTAAQVRKVVVTAKAADGTAVEHTWEIGQSRRRR